MPALINKSDSDWAIGSVVETNVRAGVYGMSISFRCNQLHASNLIGLYATAALISAALLMYVRS